ncbi:MAG: hypothetical protein KJ667_08970 [Alphaproteobacteria bacterium]|nr:hypothetical protein [Alphaproteobacteria bacterium]
MPLSKRTKTIVALASVFAWAALFMNPYMTDPEGARDTLDSHGFTDIETKGRPMFLSCGGGGDLWKTEFTARNPQGKEVSGIVCKGLNGSKFILH